MRLTCWRLPVADIEDLIREAAKDGRLAGLTMWMVSGGFQANLKDAKTGGWSCKIAADPVTAIAAALGGVPLTDVIHPPAERVSQEDVFG